MKQITNKIKDGILVGVGIMLVFGITSLSYAAFSWITQTPVAGGDTLTATKWNDMLNNQNYLKENVEAKVSKAGDTMAGPINMGTNKITNLGVPVASTDAATKSYADSVSASTSGGVVYCVTKNTYNGNLGGLSGADSKCASDCGTGFKFATISELSNFDTIRGEDDVRVNGINTSYTCSSRLDGSSVNLGSSISAGGLFIVNSTTECKDALPIACIRY